MAKKKSKAGRPPSATPKSHQLMTRLDESTYAELQAAAERDQRSAAWIIRQATLEWLQRNGRNATGTGTVGQ